MNINCNFRAENNPRFFIKTEYLEKKISINATSAEVIVTELIAPGIYDFDIVAEIKKLKLLAKTTVLLVISSSEMAFEYALQVVEIEEESRHENILSFNDESCTYMIQSQTPNQGKRKCIDLEELSEYLRNITQNIHGKGIQTCWVIFYLKKEGLVEKNC